VAASLAAWAGVGASFAAAPGGHHAASFATALAWWAAMVVAMMLPLAAPHARWLAFRSLRRLRHQAIALFAAAYLLPWLIFGAVTIAALRPVQGDAAALVLALLAAAAWQTAPARRRLLRRCGASRAPTLKGRRARADWLRTGLRAGTRCVGTCWALMLPMAVAHHPALMLAIALVITSERATGPNPERRGGRPHEAVALAAATVGVAALAVAA
jgi:predicted metal-binding membrane protein